MDKREKLLKSAKELFETEGYKKTNIAMIAHRAGVATGTYYLYFKSKDSLFMELYIEENRKLKERMLTSVNKNEPPMMVMSKMMVLNHEAMTSNPILNHWYDQEVFSKIERNFKAENGLDNLDFLYDAFTEIIEYWQNNQMMRKDIASSMIMAMFKALIEIDLHKEAIGIEYFPELLIHLSEFTMAGLEIKAFN